MEFVLVQALAGLAGASALFLVASGLSLIFGVTRIVNFAHGSLYMLGAYVAFTLQGPLTAALGPVGFWLGVVGAAVAVGLIGGVLEIGLLRRIYRAPEMLQLLATFGVVLVLQDLVLSIWGPEDLLGARPPGLDGAVEIGGNLIPTYDLFLLVVGPAVLAGLWLLMHRTRWGLLVRAAAEDREMVAALGVDQRKLFTGVVVLGAALAGLGGALQLARAPAHLGMDLAIIADVFVVVVIGGMGSITGAFVAAVTIGVLQAFGVVFWPEGTLVMAFLVMAAVLILRPRGMFGRAVDAPVPDLAGARPFRARSARQWTWAWAGLAGLAVAPWWAPTFALTVMTEIWLFAVFAISLHLIMGLGGLVSFGHAAFFGLGAYATALLIDKTGVGMLPALALAPVVAGLAGLAFGAIGVRRAGVYLAMLTLAFAQIVWSTAFQWYGFTGGDNGILGVWPDRWADGPAPQYWIALAVLVAAMIAQRRFAHAPLGMALRAARDSEDRALASGLPVVGVRWVAFGAAGALAGLAGGLFALFKGSVFPDVAAIPHSVDALAIVLLGGIQTLLGPVVGAIAFVGAKTELMAATLHWRAVIGGAIVLACVAFPMGLAGALRDRIEAPARAAR